MRNGGAVNDATTGETVSEWYQRYFDWRKARAMGAETADESRGRVRKWIEKKFGTRAIRSITRDDLERFASFLDEQVNATVIASKTATNLWGEITVAFAFATKGKNKFGKNLGLRVLDVNPADGAAGPESGVSKQKTFLRPDEVTKLLSSKDVPLERRQVYAVAIYTGMRQGELRGLRVADVDFDARQISVARQLKNGREKMRTKTGRARIIQIEANLLPLLAALTEGKSTTERLLTVRAHNRCAAHLREDLIEAGCTREALHVDPKDPMRARIKFHNLRDTCLTHMAVRRDPPQDIQWRAGHTTAAMTETYISNARYEAGHSFGEPLGRLPECLFDTGSARSMTSKTVVCEESAASEEPPVSATNSKILPTSSDEFLGGSIPGASTNTRFSKGRISQSFLGSGLVAFCTEVGTEVSLWTAFWRWTLSLATSAQSEGQGIVV